MSDCIVHVCVRCPACVPGAPPFKGICRLCDGYEITSARLAHNWRKRQERKAKKEASK